MKIAVTTLFEKNYHYGVGSLTNSLAAKGFKGDIYAGYKGGLPIWADDAKINSNLDWPNAKTLKVSEGVFLHFLPLVTDYNLTNYKPDFMLELLKGVAKDVDAICYYDPDIIQKVSWNFMEQWLNCGVAVCEDFNSPLEKQHPRRVYWRQYFEQFGFKLTFKNAIYVNGGFLGVKRADFNFLTTWTNIQLSMAKEIGGLDRSIFENRNKFFKKEYGDFYAFGTTDQDALNAAIEGYTGEISFLGKEAMGFVPGFKIIPHAVGKYKPWNKEFLKLWLLKGTGPAMVDILFWNHAENPIKLYPIWQIKFKKMLIKLNSVLVRFYSQL